MPYRGQKIYLKAGSAQPIPVTMTNFFIEEGRLWAVHRSPWKTGYSVSDYRTGVGLPETDGRTREKAVLYGRQAARRFGKDRLKRQLSKYEELNYGVWMNPGTPINGLRRRNPKRKNGRKYFKRRAGT